MALSPETWIQISSSVLMLAGLIAYLERRFTRLEVKVSALWQRFIGDLDNGNGN